jgi:hypothetical protein
MIPNKAKTLTTGARGHGKRGTLWGVLKGNRFAPRLGAAVMGLVFLAGCHPAALIIPSYLQTVGVQLVDNRTSYYGLDTIFTESLIRQFQEDGRIPLAPPDQADLVVKLIIKQFNIDPLFYAPTTNYVLQYRISITYDLAAVDQREKKTFLEDTNKIHSYYYYTPQYYGAIVQTQDQAVTSLADDTALVVVRRVLEGQ